MTSNYGLWARCQDKRIAFALLGATAMGLAQAQAPGAAPQPGAAAAMPAPSSELPGGAATPLTDRIPNPTGVVGEERAAASHRPWSFVPRITLAETFTDNVAPASGFKRSDQVTEIAPGLRFDSFGPRLNFHLDYQLRQLLYAQESDRRNTQNHLNAFGTLEAVDKWLYLDVAGVIAQQEVTPFSLQSASTVTVNPNRVETTSLRVSPYIKGVLGGAADYELRYNRSATRSSSASVSDQDTEEWNGTLKGPTPLAALNWALEGSHRTIDYQNGRDVDADRFRGLLAYKIHPEFRISVSAGQETNNFASAHRETHDTYGYGFDWQPSERTRVSAFREKRFFGYGHTISAVHRTPLTALRFVDTRDVSILPGRFTSVGFGSIHDLLATQLTSSIPDPVERARFVDSLLQQFGISPDVQVTRGFFSSRVTAERRQELSYSLQGKRDILTLAVGRTEHERVDSSASTSDVFATNRDVRQWGYSINYGHRLTPMTTLTAQAAKQNSSGSDTNQHTQLRSLNVGVTTQLGPNTTAALGARRALFDSNTGISYSEKALIASITARF